MSRCCPCQTAMQTGVHATERHMCALQPPPCPVDYCLTATVWTNRSGRHPAVRTMYYAQTGSHNWAIQCCTTATMWRTPADKACCAHIHTHTPFVLLRHYLLLHLAHSQIWHVYHHTCTHCQQSYTHAHTAHTGHNMGCHVYAGTSAALAAPISMHAWQQGLAHTSRHHHPANLPCASAAGAQPGTVYTANLAHAHSIPAQASTHTS